MASLHTWLLRLLLALGLFTASELLLWSVRYYPGTAQDGALALPIWATAAAYLAMAAAVLDYAARFRARDIFSLLLLTGVYGLSQALLISPALVLRELPLALATRALGAHGLMGLAALALLLWLAGRWRARWFAVGAAAIGFVWGVWARYSQPYWMQDTAIHSAVTVSARLDTMLMNAALLWIAVAMVAWLARRTLPTTQGGSLTPRLRRVEAAPVALVHAALVAHHVSRGDIDIVGFLLCLSLYGLCVLMLWFHKRARGDTYVEALAAFSPRWRWLGLGAALFLIAGALSWQLPRGAGAADPVALVTSIFTAFGLVWLPAVALVLGLRAFRRDTRAMRL